MASKAVVDGRNVTSWNSFTDEVSTLRDKTTEKFTSLKEVDISKRVTDSVYKNEYRVVQIEILQYILFLVLLYYYNPMSISTKHTAINNVLVLIVAFIYVVIFIFIKERKWDNTEVSTTDSNKGPDSSSVMRFILMLLCFILFMYVIKGFVWILMYTSFLNMFKSVMSILVISGIIGVIYLIYTKWAGVRKTNNSTSKFEKIKNLFIKIILYIPCFLIDVSEQIKKEFKLTTKPVWILLIIELLLVVSWIVLPPLFEKTIATADGIKLLNDPVNLNIKTSISSFNQKSDKNELPLNLDEIYSKKMNKQASDDKAEEPELYDNELNCVNTGKPTSGVKAFFNNLNIPMPKIKWEIVPSYSDIGAHHRFKYRFAISAWFYINSFPSNTNSAYSKFTNILGYGNIIVVSFNSALNELRVTSGLPESPIIIYSDRNVKFQMWNNIVINYHDGNLDVFLNGILVGTKNHIQYMKFNDIVVGEHKGLHGGICNVTYFNSPRTSKNIMLTYKLLRNKREPYINSYINEYVDVEQNKPSNRDIKHKFAM